MSVCPKKGYSTKQWTCVVIKKYINEFVRYLIFRETPVGAQGFNLVGGWATPLKNDGVRQLG